jgi:hypothetical protein
MKHRITLDTTTNIANFVLAVSKLPDNVRVFIRNRDGSLSIDGKSFLGLAHAKEFDELYCVCDTDIYNIIKDFVV